MVCRFFSISFQEDEKKRDCPLADVFSIPRYPGINAYCYRICRRLREIIEQTLSSEILVIEGGEGMNIFGIFRIYFLYRIFQFEVDFSFLNHLAFGNSQFILRNN